MPVSTSHSANGKTCRLEQRAGFEQRQPDNARMAPGNPCDQPLGAALNGISPGFAVPLAARNVGIDFGGGERLEADDRFGDAFTQGAEGPTKAIADSTL